MHKIKTLKNGIRVVYEKNTFIRSVALGIWIDVGSVNETENEAGITHFIEHMLFKGTKTRTAKDIAEEMDQIGGQINAFTSRERTCYYAKTLDENIKTAISVLSDMLYNSTFTQEEINKECNVILEELSMCEDDIDDVAHEHMMNQVYSDSSYERPIIGYKDTITKFTTKMCKDYVEKWYVPKNIVISVAGNFDESELFSMLEFYFGEKKFIEKEVNQIIQPKFNKVVSVKEKEAEQLHLILTFNGIHSTSDDIYNMAVFNTLFGGGMSSILFQNIREKNGLAYSVFSHNSNYRQSGLYNIVLALNPQNKALAVDLIESEIKKIDKISEPMFNKAKQQIKSNYLLSLENTTNRMNSLGKTLLLRNKVFTTDEVLKRISDVKHSSMVQCAKNILDLNKYSVISVGNVKTT